MIAETTFKGLPALQLSDASTRLTVIPAWGGKIAEMFDARRKREWLFENPALPYRLPEYGADYVRDFDVGGFDECFPTVGACLHPSAPWQATPLPDHGEVWSIPWSARVDGERLQLETHGVRLPYRLHKSIRLPGDGRVRLDYRAYNLTPFPMPFVWSSHPLFAIRPGMRIELPAERVKVHAAPAFPRPVHHGDSLPWPGRSGLDLATVPQPSAGLAIKLFTPPLTEGWAALSDPSDGAGFRFDFDPALVPQVGVWLNYGGWAGAPKAKPYFNLTLEPCIGAPDDLDTAVSRWGEFGVLTPGEAREWWLDVTLA